MSSLKGSSVTEVLVWWKGLAKELELDIEDLHDAKSKGKDF